MNSKAPYGYVKSPSDRHKLIVDDVAATVVRRIFSMYASGYNGRYIAERLNEEGIDCPRAYFYKQIGKPNPYINESETWGSNTVMQLMKNQVYIGNMVHGKRKMVSFKSKKCRAVDPDDWIVVKNTREAILDNEVWQAAQRRLSEGKKVQVNSLSDHGLFSGIIRCADCGGALSFSLK